MKLNHILHEALKFWYSIKLESHVSWKCKFVTLNLKDIEIEAPLRIEAPVTKNNLVEVSHKIVKYI